MDSVPDDILQKVLVYLDYNSLQEASLVSHKWLNNSQQVDEIVYEKTRQQHELGRLQSEFSAMGYRDGLDIEQDAKLQEGFNEGFANAFEKGHKLGYSGGVLAGLSLFLHNNVDLAMQHFTEPDINHLMELNHVYNENILDFRNTAVYSKTQSSSLSELQTHAENNNDNSNDNGQLQQSNKRSRGQKISLAFESSMSSIPKSTQHSTTAASFTALPLHSTPADTSASSLVGMPSAFQEMTDEATHVNPPETCSYSNCVCKHQSVSANNSSTLPLLSKDDACILYPFLSKFNISVNNL